MNNIDNEILKNVNIDFSKLSSSSLLELVYYVVNFFPVLRSSLDLNNSITFGCEIEFEGINDRKLLSEDVCKNFPHWKFKDDLSLKKGAEICSPCMNDDSKNWIDLSNVCEVIKKGASIGDNCGGHIHVGAHIFEGIPDYLIKFIKLWSVYENVIFRFSYGEYLSGRMNINSYASTCANKLWGDYVLLSSSKENDITAIINTISGYNRRQAVNFKNVKNIQSLLEYNTVEFRCPNGTLDAVVWQNNINFFVKLLECVKSNRYNDDVIDRRRKINNGVYSNLNMYDEIYLDQALELADMIFSSTKDKIYFLNQYLKSFDISSDCKKKVKTK